MKAKITLHIYAKTTKANAAGQLPIYNQQTVDYQDLEFIVKINQKSRMVIRTILYKSLVGKS